MEQLAEQILNTIKENTAKQNPYIEEQLEDLTESIVNLMFTALFEYIKRAETELTQPYYSESSKGTVLNEQLTKYNSILEQFKTFKDLLKNL